MRKEQFETITRWQRNTFKASNSFTKIEHLKEELDELVYDLQFDEKEKEWSSQSCGVIF